MVYGAINEKGGEITFQKYATTEDIENLIHFCSDSLRRYPFRKSSPLQKQNIAKSKSL